MTRSAYCLYALPYAAGLKIVGEAQIPGPGPHCSSSPDLSQEWGLATLMNPMRSLLAQGACRVPTPST